MSLIPIITVYKPSGTYERKTKMQKAFILVVCLFITPVVVAAGNVADTLHNLSISGKGQFKSQTEDRICIFCHTPHTAAPDSPMWNRRSNGYTSYKSSSTDATAGKPGGSSALCLSCHDGTIALGDMISSNRNQRARPNDLRSTFLKGRSNLGTDLSNDHQVAIVFDTGLQPIIKIIIEIIILNAIIDCLFFIIIQKYYKLKPNRKYTWLDFSPGFSTFLSPCAHIISILPNIVFISPERP